MNKDTYTPMVINGEIVVVVDAPDQITEQANSIISDFTYVEHIKRYNELIAACTKYPTLPQDKEYWQSKIGEQVEIAVSDIGYGEVAIPKINGRGEFTPMDNLSCSICGYFCNNYHHHNCWFEVEQPKQGDGDLWDDAIYNACEYADGKLGTLNGGIANPVEWLIEYERHLKQHYNLTKK